MDVKMLSANVGPKRGWRKSYSLTVSKIKETKPDFVLLQEVPVQEECYSKSVLDKLNKDKTGDEGYELFHQETAKGPYLVIIGSCKWNFSIL